MPNLTFFIWPQHMPQQPQLNLLTAECDRLCRTVLEAQPGTVHILYVAAQAGQGHPVFADIRYRLTEARTPSVMNQFMTEMDQSIHHLTGLTARIRCFGYGSTNLHARN